MNLKSLVLSIAAMFVATTLNAQALKVGVIDMERAIVQTIEGKKAETTFTAKFDEHRKNIESKQRQLEDAQNKLKTQDRLLDNAARAERTKEIESQQTELT